MAVAIWEYGTMMLAIIQAPKVHGPCAKLHCFAIPRAQAHWLASNGDAVLAVLLSLKLPRASKNKKKLLNSPAVPHIIQGVPAIVSGIFLNEGLSEALGLMHLRPSPLIQHQMLQTELVVRLLPCLQGLVDQHQGWQGHYRTTHRILIGATANSRAPKDHINIRILPTMVSGIPLVLGLGTRMSDPYVYVAFWAPK